MTSIELQTILDAIDAQRDPAARAERCRQGLALIPHKQDPVLWATFHMKLAESLIYSDDYKEAIVSYMHALEIFSFQNFPEQWAKIQFEIGVAYVGSGAYGRGDWKETVEQAISHWKKAIMVFGQIGNRSAQTEVLHWITLAYYARDNPERYHEQVNATTDVFNLHSLFSYLFYRDITSNKITTTPSATQVDDALRPVSVPRSVDPSAVPDAEPVDAAVFCPVKVTKGHEFLVQIFLFRSDAIEAVGVQAREVDASAERRSTFTLPLDLPRGTRVDLRLEMPKLVVAEPADAFVLWHGRTVTAQFQVAVPVEMDALEAFGRVSFFVAGVPAGTLHFKVALVARYFAFAPLPEPYKAEVVRYRKAFASYSMEDESEVLRRVQAFQIAGIEVFLDHLNLTPGQQWERKLCYEIDRCDVFLLFWSCAAAASQWVAWEIDYALKRKAGSDDNPPAIQPVPIEGPPPPPPPEVLKHLHFNDAILAHIQVATTVHRASTSPN